MELYYYVNNGILRRNFFKKEKFNENCQFLTLLLQLVQVAECSTSIRACHEVAGYEDVPDTVARYTQLMELLRDQFTLCRQAHEWITDAAAYTRAPLSARIRAKIYEGGECNKRLGEFLQVLDDHVSCVCV